MAISEGKIVLLKALFLSLTSPLLLLNACTPGVVGAPEELPPFSGNCQTCARWMEGSFSNQTQAEKSGATNYYWLHQARIWPDRTDGIWLYSEFNQAGVEGTPLQQIIYRVNDNLAGGLIIKSYQLPGSLNRYLGDWRAPREFNSLDPMFLEPMPGCQITLTRDSKGALSGRSDGRDCKSMLPESSYQQTKIRIGSLGLTLWLTGYDEDNKQVFGPGASGFVMNKQDSSKAPVSIKPGTDKLPDIGPYNVEAEEKD